MLTLQLPQESLLMHADPFRLQQIFTNLLSNAARYTDRGGKIAVTASRAGELVIIKVKDTGIGIESDLQQEIFEPFLQIAPEMGSDSNGEKNNDLHQDCCSVGWRSGRRWARLNPSSTSNRYFPYGLICS